MRRFFATALLLSLVCAPLVAFAEFPGPYLACEAVGPAEPICGFQNPEDLAQTSCLMAMEVRSAENVMVVG